MNQTITQYLLTVTILLSLAACGGSNSRSMPDEPAPPPPAPTLTYQVSITNLSAAQPFSPVAVILHDSEFTGWTLGDAASDALEQLAEGGDNSEFLAGSNVVLSMGGQSNIMPGSTETLELVVDETADIQLTLATMLVNTNDGFTGVTGQSLTALEVDKPVQFALPVFDAGTEANMELVGTIPGPADGGVGFDAGRDDVNYVAMHPGVVTAAGGYSESALDESHRFDAPIALLTVIRVE